MTDHDEKKLLQSIQNDGAIQTGDSGTVVRLSTGRTRAKNKNHALSLLEEDKRWGGQQLDVSVASSDTGEVETDPEDVVSGPPR